MTRPGDYCDATCTVDCGHCKGSRLTRARLEISRRRMLAHAATPGTWQNDGAGEVFVGLNHIDAGVHSYEHEVTRPNLTHGQYVDADAEHIAANDPAHVLAVLGAAAATLDRHRTEDDNHRCSGCFWEDIWPCADATAVLDVYAPEARPVADATRPPDRTPCRVQRQRTPGWRMPENAVYVGRPTRWGNPIAFTDVSGQFPSLNERQVATLVVRKFEALAQRGSLHLPNWRSAGGLRGPVTWTYPPLPDIRAELAGRDLACWCPLDQPCHADVLLELANKGGS